ncbi:MAG: hypothetical protein RR310_08545 [Eubacterium sp.]
MKNTINIRCRKCHYEKDFYLGVGLIHSGAPDFDSEYAVIPKLMESSEMLESARHMVNDEGGCFESDYQKGLYICPVCGAFHKRFVYTIRWDDGQIYTPEYRCTCGAILIYQDLDHFEVSDHVCPECGYHSLYEGVSQFSPLENEE